MVSDPSAEVTEEKELIFTIDAAELGLGIGKQNRKLNKR